MTVFIKGQISAIVSLEIIRCNCIGYLSEMAVYKLAQLAKIIKRCNSRARLDRRLRDSALVARKQSAKNLRRK
jgi:hypothetical protein